MANIEIYEQKENILLKPNVLEEFKVDVFNAVNASIAKCYAHLNFNLPDNANYLVNEVTQSIINKFPQLRIIEISIAFENGIRHKYGDYFGLSVVSFEGFINGYLASEERAELVRHKSQLAIETKTEPTQ